MLKRPKSNRSALWRYALVAPVIALSILYLAGCDEQTKPITNETKSARQASSSIVEGRVLAQDGKPLPGADIVVLGHELGTTTDMNGNYKITLPKNTKDNVLVASFQGFATQQKTVSNTQRMDFKLANGTATDVLSTQDKDKESVSAKGKASVEMPPPPPPSEPGKVVKDNNGVYLIADEHPVFPGGMPELGRYINDNLRYPDAAKRANVSGRVFVRFIVGEDGTVRDAKILKGIGFGADEEALRLTSAMPRWKPAKVGGKPVTIQYNLPINFELPK